jgi:hypothetical protein
MAELADSLVASDDDRLDQAEALVRGFCGWHIAPSRTETVTLRGRGRSTLFLPSLHVTAVSAITDDGVTVLASDYEVSESGVLTHLTGRWGYNTDVVVTFTHGYADAPLEVAGIVQALAVRGTSATDIKQVGDIVLNTAGPTPTNVEQAVLTMYRLPVLA